MKANNKQLPPEETLEMSPLEEDDAERQTAFSQSQKRSKAKERKDNANREPRTAINIEEEMTSKSGTREDANTAARGKRKRSRVEQTTTSQRRDEAVRSINRSRSQSRTYTLRTSSPCRNQNSEHHAERHHPHKDE